MSDRIERTPLPSQYSDQLLPSHEGQTNNDDLQKTENLRKRVLSNDNENFSSNSASFEKKFKYSNKQNDKDTVDLDMKNSFLASFLFSDPDVLNKFANFINDADKGGPVLLPEMELKDEFKIPAYIKFGEFVKDLKNKSRTELKGLMVKFHSDYFERYKDTIESSYGVKNREDATSLLNFIIAYLRKDQPKIDEDEEQRRGEYF